MSFRRLYYYMHTKHPYICVFCTHIYACFVRIYMRVLYAYICVFCTHIHASERHIYIHQYGTSWIRKLDSNGDLVEIVIKVDQHKDADCDTSNCQSQSETSEDLLFAINVDLKSLRISVEGNHRDLWNQTEFLKLLDFVSDLARMEEVNTSAVNDSYDKVFGNIKNDSSSSDQCFDKSNTSINLEGVSLDIYADSGNEHDELQEINGSQSNNKSFSKSNKARSSRKSLKQIRKQSNKTPTKVKLRRIQDT